MRDAFGAWNSDRRAAAAKAAEEQRRKAEAMAALRRKQEEIRGVEILPAAPVAVATAAAAEKLRKEEAAKAKAAQRRQSFSAYVNSLLAADLGCELSATEAAEIRPEPARQSEPKAA